MRSEKEQTKPKENKHVINTEQYLITETKF